MHPISRFLKLIEGSSRCHTNAHRGSTARLGVWGRAPHHHLLLVELLEPRTLLSAGPSTLLNAAVKGAVGGSIPATHVPVWASQVPSSSTAGTGAQSSSATQHETLGNLPAAAQSAISSAIGQDQSAYHATSSAAGVTLANAANGFTASMQSGNLVVAVGANTWDLSLAGLGYGGAIQPVGTAQTTVNGNRVDNNYGTVDEWYVNGPGGLEQGFNVSPTPQDEASGSLTVALAMGGDLSGTVNAAGDGLTLTRPDGSMALGYTGLEAHDATGKALPATLEVQTVGGQKELLIHVNTAGAQGQITIDPNLQQIELIASDETESDQFGCSVATNGNTVVVGATERFDSTTNYNTGPGEAYIFTMSGSVWNQVAKLTASDGALGDWFGGSVAISGNTVVVGAVDACEGDSGFGAAYVFVEPPTGWTNMTQTAELTPSDGSQEDYFGESVSISGNTVVVGAYNAVIGGSSSYQGAAYVYVEPAAGWGGNETQAAKLTASDGAANDEFGDSVAIDGNTVVVGAPGATVGGNTEQGAAYVFTAPSTGWVGSLTQTAKLNASDGAANDGFGDSVAIDGNTVVVGADAWPEDASYVKSLPGAAYVFTAPTSGWSGNLTQTAKLNASDGAPNDLFGESVAISGNKVVVGAVHANVGDNFDWGAAYVYTEPSTGWAGSMAQTAKLNASVGCEGDSFGNSISINGSTIVIGAPWAEGNGDYAPGPGTVYAFGTSATNPNTPTNTTPSDGATGISLSPTLEASTYYDGEGEGQAAAEWVVKRLSDDATVFDSGQDPDDLSSCVIPSGYLAGLTGYCWQVCYECSDGMWSTYSTATSFTTGAITVAPPSNETVPVGQILSLALGSFTESNGTAPYNVDVNWGDGSPDTPIHGLTAAGLIPAQNHTYTTSGNDTITVIVTDSANHTASAMFTVFAVPMVAQATKLVAFDSADSVAIEGRTLVVGSREATVGTNYEQGAAYVFTGSGSSWTEVAELTASDGAEEGDFGSSVAIDGNTVVVGAEDTTVNGNQGEGAAYVFTEPSTGWTNMTQTTKLTASDGAAGDEFGNSVAISDNTVVVGAPNATIGGNQGEGAAYVFTEPAFGWGSESNFTQTAKLIPSDNVLVAGFGSAVAVASSTVVVGASTWETGGFLPVACVFTEPLSGWESIPNMTQTSTLTETLEQDDSFSYSIAISGNTVVIGAPAIGSYDYQGAAYVFTEPVSGWGSEPNITPSDQLTPSDGAEGDQFGTAVAISGNTVVVGAPYITVGDNEYQGAAYVFTEPVSGWGSEPNMTQAAELVATDDTSGDLFGDSVAINGNTVVVGVPDITISSNENQGAVYVFGTAATLPTVSNLRKGVNQNTTLTFAASDFTAAFSDSNAGATLQTIQITSLPSEGTLILGTSPVTLNQEIAASAIDTLSYTPAAGFTGADSFGWNGSDGNAYSTSGASVNLTISGVPSHLAIMQQTVGAVASVPLSPAFIVQVEDANGNVVSSDDSNVSLALRGNANGATLNGTTTVAAINGVATFNNLSLSKTGTYTLLASDGVLADALSGSITVTTSPTHLAFKQEPTTIIAGHTIGPALTIQVLDATNHVVVGDNSTVNLSVGSGPAGGGLTGTLSLQAQNGIATFTGLSATTAGTYTLTAIDGSLTLARSSKFTVTPDVSTAQLVPVPPPATPVIVGETLPIFVVDIKDQYGNLVTTGSLAMSTALLSITSGPGTFNKVPTNPKATGGVIKFSNLVLSTAGDYALQIADASLPIATPVQVTQTITQGVTTVATPHPSSSYTFGQTLNLSTTFKSTAATTVPFTGTASILDQSSQVLGTGTLTSAGLVKFTLTGVVPGTYDCTLSYPGDTNHTAVTSSAFTLQVNLAGTTTSLAASTNTLVFGQPLTLTATVKSSNAPAVARTGSVNFYDGTTLLQTVPLTGNAASYMLTPASVGKHSYKAVYSGDGNFKASTSSGLSRTVSKDKTSILLTPTLTSPIAENQTFNLNVQMAVLAPGVSTLTGDLVTIKDNGKTLGTLTLDSSGEATLTGLNYTAAGTQSLTALFAGDADTLAVTSSVLKLTIDS